LQAKRKLLQSRSNKAAWPRFNSTTWFIDDHINVIVWYQTNWKAALKPWSLWPYDEAWSARCQWGCQKWWCLRKHEVKLFLVFLTTMNSLHKVITCWQCGIDDIPVVNATVGFPWHFTAPNCWPEYSANTKQTETVTNNNHQRLYYVLNKNPDNHSIALSSNSS
jgi:hypothetical protein